MNKIFALIAFLICIIFSVRLWSVYPVHKVDELISKNVVLEKIDSYSRSVSFNLKFKGDSKEYYATKFIDDRYLESMFFENDKLKLLVAPTAEYSSKSEKNNLYRVYSIIRNDQSILSFEKSSTKLRNSLISSALISIIFLLVGVYFLFFSRYMSFESHITK